LTECNKNDKIYKYIKLIRHKLAHLHCIQSCVTIEGVGCSLSWVYMGSHLRRAPDFPYRLTVPNQASLHPCFSLPHDWHISWAKLATLILAPTSDTLDILQKILQGVLKLSNGMCSSHTFGQVLQRPGAVHITIKSPRMKTTMIHIMAQIIWGESYSKILLYWGQVGLILNGRVKTTT
jgi:hypothetical protein